MRFGPRLLQSVKNNPSDSYHFSEPRAKRSIKRLTYFFLSQATRQFHFADEQGETQRGCNLSEVSSKIPGRTPGSLRVVLF